MRNLFALVVFTLAVSVTQAQLVVKDIQTCCGPLGPPRAPVYDQSDDIFVRFKVTGAQPNSEGRISLDIQMDVHGPNGEILQHSSTTFHSTQLFTKEAAIHSWFSIPSTWKPGEYIKKLTLKDNHSGTTTSFSQKFTVRPERLAILPPQFFHDEEGRWPAPNGGLVFQLIHYKFWIVGLAKNKGIVDFELHADLRDHKGQQVLWQIENLRKKETDPEIVKQIQSVTHTGTLPLESAGDFILHLMVTDHVADKTVTCDFPVHIEAPGTEKWQKLGNVPTSVISSQCKPNTDPSAAAGSRR